MRRLIFIGGPTAVGKSDIACCVASELGGEIISADSMSVYKHMDIGTAKPKDCMEKVVHHLVDILEPGELFDAKLFEEMALRAIALMHKKGMVPLVVGGTYLYLQALLYGIEDTPKPNWTLRRRFYRIAEEKGSAYLFSKLKAIDGAYATKIHPNDLRRVIRALEVFVETGKRFSWFHRWGLPRFEYVALFLNRSWESLSERIESRVRAMISEGLVNEVKALMDMGFRDFLTSPQAIGYKEVIPYLDGRASLAEAVENVIRNTKRYARRQIRWFRKQKWEEINLDDTSKEEACRLILERYQRA